MDIVLVALIFANLYAIVYYRLMVGHWRGKATGRAESGFLVAVSFPSRTGLPPQGLRYYRRYWYAVGTLLTLLAVATAIRLPALRQAFQSLT